MAIDKLDIRDIVMRRLGLPFMDSTHHDLIDDYINVIEEGILNYCHVSTVPDGLQYTWTAMAAAALYAEQSSILFPAPEQEEMYETKIGDTTVQPIKPITINAPAAPTPIVVESVLFDYQSSLNAYRRMRW